MQLRERIGMLDDDLGRERSGLHVPALLELEQIAAVAEHRPLSKTFEDPLRHVASRERWPGV